MRPEGLSKFKISPNQDSNLATNLVDEEGEVRRLKKFYPSDLSARFD
jgi:hypothetical protein